LGQFTRFMKSVNWPKPGYASINCSTILNIPYNLIFTTKFNDSSILIKRLFHVTIWIDRWRMNTLVTSQYQHRLSSITKIFSRRISQSDWNIQTKLNYIQLLLHYVKNAQENKKNTILSYNRDKTENNQRIKWNE
jgi:hypothetical protein